MKTILLILAPIVFSSIQVNAGTSKFLGMEMARMEKTALEMVKMTYRLREPKGSFEDMYVGESTAHGNTLTVVIDSGLCSIPVTFKFRDDVASGEEKVNVEVGESSCASG